MEILCFCAGVAFFYTKSFYPLLAVCIAVFLKPNWFMPLCFLIAMIWGGMHQWWIAEQNMPEALVLAKARIEGQIVSIPIVSPGKTQFQFALTRLNDQAVKTTVLLSCYNKCPSFKAGQFWGFQAKLKRPANLGNPGAFDLLNSLKGRHLFWTGYLNPRYAQRLGEAKASENLLALREHLAERLKKMMPDSESLAVIQALALGVTANLDKAQWDLFRHTGTTHLMVISGAHIGLVAGLCCWLMKWIWSRFYRLPLLIPATQVAAFVGFIMALVYSLLAGFAAPAQRALIACFFLLLKNFFSSRFTAWQSWRYALLAIVCYEPHVILLPGFYLSFIAVATLLLASNRSVSRGFKKAIYLQAACLFGLMPLSLYWFSYGSINGFLANLLAIPWVGLVIVPLSLITTFIVQGIEVPALMLPVQGAIELLLFYLRWIDSFSAVNLTISFSQLWQPLALMLVLMLWILFPLRAIYPALILLTLAACFPVPLRIKEGDARIDIVDVGQGLAIVVNTANHSLVYDTGMKFYRGGDMAVMALIPLLNYYGINKLDKIVISHPDLDHRGGLPSLEEKYPAAELVVDKPGFYQRGHSCHHYPAWSWDQVSFRFLAIAGKFRDKNNGSCILQIENKAGRILFTGDIESKGEDYLVKTFSEALASQVVVIPHHGSKTSSTPHFIRKIAPQYAVISAGFDNRFHFPHQQTLDTLKKQNIQIYNTIDCGMVSFVLDAREKKLKPSCYKRKLRDWFYFK